MLYAPSVKAPSMVGSTWTRIRFVLGSDCSLSWFQGTSLPRFLLHAFLIDCSMGFDTILLLVATVLGSRYFSNWYDNIGQCGL